MPGAPTALDSLHDFFEFDTIRIDGLPGKSKTYVDVLQLPLLLAAADHFLLSTSLSYLLNTGQLIEIHPGQTAQVLHRDEQGWMECVSDK